MSDPFDRDAFIATVAHELNLNPEEVEPLARGALMLASAPIERSKKKTATEHLEKIRDAAAELAKALESNEASTVAFFGSGRMADAGTRVANRCPAPFLGWGNMDEATIRCRAGLASASLAAAINQEPMLC